jgi:hypothetical protein
MLGQFISGYVRLRHVISDYVSLEHVRPGQSRLCQVRLDRPG